MRTTQHDQAEREGAAAQSSPSKRLLICAGSLTIDNIVTAEGRLLPPTHGGNAVYSALAARLWHQRVGILSRVGTGYSSAYLSMIADAGIDLSGIVPVDAPHGMNVAFRYDRHGGRVRRFPDDFLAILPKAEALRFIDYSAYDPIKRYTIWHQFTPNAGDLSAEWIEEAFGLHCASMPVQKHHSLAARIRAENSSSWIQVDSPWYDDRDRSLDHATELFGQIDALLPSIDDIVDWEPLHPWETGLERLVNCAPGVLVVKRGAGGSLVVMRNGIRVEIPVAQDIAVVDPTGAGDAFCGGFIAGMFLTGAPALAALYGTISASFAVESVGASGLLSATPREAQRRLDRLIAQQPKVFMEV